MLRSYYHKMPSTKIVFLLLMLTYCGCSSGWHHSYDHLNPEMRAQGYGRVVVITRDVRPLVGSGAKQASFIGTVKSTLGDPWDIQTQSGQAFAQDLSKSICNTLNQRGFDCLPLISSGNEVQNELDYLMQTEHPLRMLYLELRSWQVDVYMKATIDYDMTLWVYNGSGDLMASVSTKGKDEPELESYFNPAKSASIVAPQSLEHILSLLLKHEHVTKALHLVRSIDALGAKY